MARTRPSNPQTHPNPGPRAQLHGDHFHHVQGLLAGHLKERSRLSKKSHLLGWGPVLFRLQAVEGTKGSPSGQGFLNRKLCVGDVGWPSDPIPPPKQCIYIYLSIYPSIYLHIYIYMCVCLQVGDPTGSFTLAPFKPAKRGVVLTSAPPEPLPP